MDEKTTNNTMGTAGLEADVKKEELDEKSTPIGIVEQPDGLAILKDGMRLHPQPTSDPLDPLNWSSLKKHTVLAIVMYLLVPLFPIMHSREALCFRKIPRWKSPLS